MSILSIAKELQMPTNEEIRDTLIQIICAHKRLSNAGKNTEDSIYPTFSEALEQLAEALNIDRVTASKKIIQMDINNQNIRIIPDPLEKNTFYVSIKPESTCDQI
jgi:hypothetical protein